MFWTYLRLLFVEQVKQVKLLCSNRSKAYFLDKSNVKSNTWVLNSYKSNTKSIIWPRISTKSNVTSNTLMSPRWFLKPNILPNIDIKVKTLVFKYWVSQLWTGLLTTIHFHIVLKHSMSRAIPYQSWSDFSKKYRLPL